MHVCVIWKWSMGRGEGVRQDWETRQGRDMCVMKVKRTLERRGPARRGRGVGQIEQNIVTYMSANVTLKPITLCVL